MFTSDLYTSRIDESEFLRSHQFGRPQVHLLPALLGWVRFSIARNWPYFREVARRLDGWPGRICPPGWAAGALAATPGSVSPGFHCCLLWITGFSSRGNTETEGILDAAGSLVNWRGLGTALRAEYHKPVSTSLWLGFSPSCGVSRLVALRPHLSRSPSSISSVQG